MHVLARFSNLHALHNSLQQAIYLTKVDLEADLIWSADLAFEKVIAFWRLDFGVHIGTSSLLCPSLSTRYIRKLPLPS